jgi:uncharacterized membrane protein YecN with MAPEG domain
MTAERVDYVPGKMSFASLMEWCQATPEEVIAAWKHLLMYRLAHWSDGLQREMDAWRRIQTARRIQAQGGKEDGRYDAAK